MKFVPIFLIACVLMFVPADIVLAQAQSDFVTCSGPDCSMCNLVQMANYLIVWLFGIFFLVFAVIMVTAGFGLVTSGGNQSALEAAKSKFKNGIIGLLIVMAAWLLVHQIMVNLLDGGEGQIGAMPWNQVQCQVQTVPTEWSRTGNDDVGGVVTAPTNPSGASSSHSAAVAALGDGFVVTSSGKCSDKNVKTCTSLDGMKDLTIQRVKELQSAVGQTLVVTGGTETGHSEKGTYTHGNGYKIDLKTTPALNDYVQSNYTSIGGSKWKDPNGNIYYRHGPPDHWDVSVTH